MEQATNSCGGDRTSRRAQYETRDRERKVLELWLKGNSCEEIAARPDIGLSSRMSVWRAKNRALNRIGKEETDRARLASLARLQAIRVLAWQASAKEPIAAGTLLVRIEAREARLLGLDKPSVAELNDEEKIPLSAVRAILARAEKAERFIDVKPVDSRDGYNSEGCTGGHTNGANSSYGISKTPAK